jgi:hypothetical protein
MYAKNTFWCQNSELTVNFKNMIAQSKLPPRKKIQAEMITQEHTIFLYITPQMMQEHSG